VRARHVDARALDARALDAVPAAGRLQSAMSPLIPP
jgi:hypothetical protein